MTGLARPAAAAVARRLTRGELPDGPVVMWAAVLAENGALLAAAPTPPGVWNWYQGGLVTRLPPTSMPVIAAGTVNEVWLIAVTGHQWAPVTPLILDGPPPAIVSLGDLFILTDAKIKHNFGGPNAGSR